MARITARVLPLASRSLPGFHSPETSTSLEWSTVYNPALPSSIPSIGHLHILFGSQKRNFHNSYHYSRHQRPFIAFFAALRGFRKVRWWQAVRKKAPDEKKLELRVKISIEDSLPDDHEIVNIVAMLKLDVPMAMKVVFDSLKELKCRAQNSFMEDISKYEKIELSILLCNDELISELKKECAGSNRLSGFISRVQNSSELEIPILTLGDIVISAESATRQAVERGHKILDEIRILMIHGLLQLLGLDHEMGDETSTKVEKLEELIFRSIGWKGRGLTKVVYDVAFSGIQSLIEEGKMSSAKKTTRNLRFYRPKFSYIFCNVEGTLLNSQSQVTDKTAEALREALSRGVRIIVATGKTRPTVIDKLKMVDLDGQNGIVSKMSPGIFLQGLLVYGRHGRQIYRRNLDQSVCREALSYSIEHEVPLIVFCEDRCLTLFDHPLVDSVHTIYHEPKAKILRSVEHLLTANIQKIMFLDTAGDSSSFLRPYWEEVIDGRACIVRTHPDMLEIIPAGTSTGDGVKVLLDHLGISAKEILAIGGGEEDIEMLKLASLAVVLRNGSEKAKAAADVIGPTNDEDGVAVAIYQYAF